MKELIVILVGIGIAGAFLILIYKFLPLGVALAITGAMFASGSLMADSKRMWYVYTAGSWLFPIGVVITFIQSGWKWGIASLLLAFWVYRKGKN